MRTYWTEEWVRTRTHDELVSFSELTGGWTAVHITQGVRSFNGSAFSQGHVLHFHRVEDSRISRIDIEAHLEP